MMKNKPSKRYKVTLYLVDTPREDEDYLTRDELLEELKLNGAIGLTIEDNKRIKEITPSLLRFLFQLRDRNF